MSGQSWSTWRCSWFGAHLHSQQRDTGVSVTRVAAGEGAGVGVGVGVSEGSGEGVRVWVRARWPYLRP